MSNPLKYQTSEGVGYIEVYHDGIANLAKSLFSSYPLRLMQKKGEGVNRKTCLTIYYLGFGGGLVAGDKVELTCLLHEKTTLCLKSTGLSKVFKSKVTDAVTCQYFHCQIQSEAMLLQVLDPVACYHDAKFYSKQVYNIDAHGSCILVDWYTSGRKNRGEIWSAESIRSEIDITYNNQSVFHEDMCLHSSCMWGASTVAERVGNASVFGTVILVGHRTKYSRERLKVLTRRETYDEYSSNVLQHKRSSFPDSGTNIDLADPLVSVSTLSDDMTVVRFFGDSLEDSYHLLRGLLIPSSHDMDEMSTNASSMVDESILSADIFGGRIHSGPDDFIRATETITALRILQQYDMT